MIDDEAIRQMAYASGISAEVRDHAIGAIETLAKARALLSAYAEFRFSAVIDDNTDKLVDGLYGLYGLYGLLEVKP